MNIKGDLAIDIANLKIDFERIKQTYRSLFCAIYKLDYDSSFWTGYVLSVGDYFLDFYDIIYAVNNKIDESVLYSWYDYDLTLGENNLGHITLEQYSTDNLPYTIDDIKRLQDLQQKKCEVERDIETLVFKLQYENKHN